MQVYESEIKDGLKDQILSSKICIACELFTKSDSPLDANKALITALANANPDQRDLFYKHSILASVGWNANDDVFDKEETWKARFTPVDKQINFMHNELEIIGHSTSSFVYNDTGNLIDDKTPVEQLPDRFDVVTEFVLYSMWENPERQELMQKLISEINEGKWFVSMECKFPAFDYAVIDNQGNHKTIARNQNTSFLTKHLKAFGGDGTYQGWKIGRLIRNFFFCGQGIVDKPANVRSIIFDKAIAFTSSGSLDIKGNKQMEEQLKQEIAKLQAQIDNFNKQKYEETIAGLKAQLDEANKALAAFDKSKEEDDKKKKDEDEKAKNALIEKDKAIASLTDELKVANDKLTVASKELESIKKDAATAARVSKLVAAGLTDELAKTEAAKWSALADEQFDEIVTLQKAKVEAAKAAAGATTTKTEADLTKAEAEKTVAGNTTTEGKAAAELAKITECLTGAMPFSSKAAVRNQNKNK